MSSKEHLENDTVFLLDKTKKKKSVKFAERHSYRYISEWLEDYRQARIDDIYQTEARNRERFKRRIESIEHIIKPVLLRKKIVQDLIKSLE